MLGIVLQEWYSKHDLASIYGEGLVRLQGKVIIWSGNYKVILNYIEERDPTEPWTVQYTQLNQTYICLSIIYWVLKWNLVELTPYVTKSWTSRISPSLNHLLSLSANTMTTNVVRESLRKLLTARYVERCPAPEPVVSTPVEEATTRKRGAKSAKVIVHSCLFLYVLCLSLINTTLIL